MQPLASLIAELPDGTVVTDPDIVASYRQDRAADPSAGTPIAVVRPRRTEEVQATLRWATAHRIAVVPRGMGTGLSGGATALDGGIVLSTEKMRDITVDPVTRTAVAQPGLLNAEVKKAVAEYGLWYPPDPSSFEICSIGGNIATNAGGPHAFKYGVTGRWVTGLEAVIPPGEVIEVGGPIRKDVAGYDIGALLIGSEGTLGIVTAAWLRLIPAPEAAAPVIAFYASPAEGCAAIETVLGSGIEAAAIEFLDAGALGAAAAGAPFAIPPQAAFMVLAEADGNSELTAATVAALHEALSEGAASIESPQTPAEIADLWRWRDSVSLAVEALHGGKVSEDVAVPLDRLAEAVEETVAIGARHGLEACSWGHAGDGNLHSTFLVDPRDEDQVARAHAAAVDLYRAAAAMGGTISGEHGLGWVKRGHLDAQWNFSTVALHEAIKSTIDPKNLMNPGKKR